MLYTPLEPTLLWPLLRPLPQGNSNPYSRVGGRVHLLLLPSGRLLIMEAMVASVSWGRGTAEGAQKLRSQEPLRPQVCLTHSVFPAFLSLLELTLARSRELALNYLTLSHIGLLASGTKCFSEQSSFLPSAF